MTNIYVGADSFYSDEIDLWAQWIEIGLIRRCLGEKPLPRYGCNEQVYTDSCTRGRNRIKSAIHFDVAIKGTDFSLAKFEKDKWLWGEGIEIGLFLGEHDIDLAFGGAVDSSGSPDFIPVS